MKKTLIAVLLTLAGWVHADNKLEEVLTRMDAAAAKFQGISAQISKTSFTAVVKEESTESGGIFIQREKKGTYKVKMELRAPDEKSILLKGDTAQVYHPHINQIEEYKLGAEKDLVDQFFLLGFGGGGHDMTKSYDVALGASDGKSVKLDLKPKGSLSKSVSKVELWLSPESWTPVRQRFTQLTRDYVDVVYSNVVEGVQKDSIFALETKGKPKKIYPGKK